MDKGSTNLSGESKTFLENLRLYLVTSGKRSSEIEQKISDAFPFKIFDLVGVSR